MNWALFALVAASLGGAVAYPREQEVAAKSPAATKNAAPQRSYFEKDPRLTTFMTIESPVYAHVRLWQGITRKTKVPIEREPWAAEFDESPIALAGKNVPARALMDAAAARVLARWERTEEGGYRLLVPRRELDQAFSPQSEHERERFRFGSEFIRILNKLPEEKQARLLSGQYVSFSSLPPEMQMSVSGMIGPLVREQQTKGWEVFPVERLSEAEFRLERKPAKEFNRLFLTARLPGGNSMGWRINDYEEKKQEQEARARQQTGEPNVLYTPVRFEITQKEAKEMPALKRVVTLDRINVTFPEVLRLLHERYGVAFVSDPRTDMPQRADVHLKPMPLGEALDKLTALYKDTEWEWRKYGVVVVRGPKNPARDRRQGKSAQEGTAQALPAPGRAAPPNVVP